MGLTYKEIMEKIQQACDVQLQQQQLIAELSEENNLLTSTILTARLGHVHEERRWLLEKVRQSEEEKQKAIHSLETYQKAYEDKYREIEARIANLKAKQLETDTYIELKAEALIIDKEEQLREEYAEKETAVREAFLMKEKGIERKGGIYRKALVGVAIYALFLMIFLLWRWPI